MKIDELMRETTIKLDQAAKGKVAAGTVTSTEVATLIADSMPDSDFFFPDLLQSFAKLLSRRQELMELLPQAAQNRLNDTAGLPQTVVPRSPESAASAGGQTVNATFPQGISGLARDSRMMIDTLRQMISELEFVERVPDLANVYEQVRIKPAEIAGQRLYSNNTVVPSVPVGAEVQAPLMQAVSQRVDETMAVLQSVVDAAQNHSVPVTTFNRLVNQAAATGKIAPELAGWVDEMAATLDQMPETPEFTAAMTKWSNQVDPRILRLAQTAEKPGLARVWVAVQALNELPQPVEQQPTIIAARTALGNDPAGQKVMPQLDVLRSVVQRIVDLPTLVQTGQPTNQMAPLSQVGRFELLLSTAAARPELLEKLLAVLPEFVTAGEIPTTSKVTPPAYQTLTQTAPQWLKTMAEREDKPVLLQFWLAAKAADLGPWVSMEPAERQQLTTALKELRTTFEQPEAFRTPREDANSRSFMMQVPLYAPGQERPYPALIQVFEEKKERGGGQLPEQEVWVRVSLETDHIGTVDLSFRLQEKKYLSIFSRFADPQAASEFRASLPELRKEMAGTSLELKKIAVAGRIHPGGKGDG
jgi:hypothetical protein